MPTIISAPLDMAHRIGEALPTAQWAAALGAAVVSGERDEGKLTNLVFFTQHPERAGRPIAKHETAEAREWIAIRNRIVRPLLTNSGAMTPPSAPAAGDMPTGPFATLRVSRPGIEFRYPITADDVLWTARMIQGEAGGRPDADNYAVIWTMLNRYALLTNPQRLKGGYRTFADFIRAYSTPLQPVLRYGSAKHHYHSAAYIPTGGVYTQNPSVPRGQLEQHLRLQRTPWSGLQATARQAAETVLKGQVPNLIGLATEFANTATYFRRQYNRASSEQEWRAYNRNFGASKSDPRGWVWIGDVPGLHQYRVNTFFLRTRPVAGDPLRTPIANLPADTVQLIRP